MPWLKWSADELASLHEFVSSGLSASKVAVKLNERHGRCFSRNAVIGRVHRMNNMLKLVGKPVGGRRNRGTKMPDKPVTPPQPRLTVQEALRDYTSTGEPHICARHVDFFGVALPPDDGECHFIEGDPKLKNHVYCRHPALRLGETFSPYCAYHAMLTHHDTRGYRLSDLLAELD